jgi:hypothetical protein
MLSIENEFLFLFFFTLFTVSFALFISAAFETSLLRTRCAKGEGCGRGRNDALEY